jgi:basic amino acid/polyamine antiporter, APA family
MASENSSEGLKRVVGLPAFAMSVVNNSIGSGIFALPAIIGIQLGAFSVFCYLFCSIMLAAIMLCYAEIGSKITSSGGSYAYVEAAFGPFAGFIANWMYTFGWGILGSAAVMNILADSLAVLFPVFTHPIYRAVLYFILLGLMVVINIFGAKSGARFVQLLTIVKLLPICFIIIFGFSHIKASNLYWEHLPQLKTFSDASLILFYAFAGFETSLGVCGELKNPQRTVPLGILLGGSIVLIVYLSLQTVTQGVLGAHISAYKDAPLAAVAAYIIGPAGAVMLVLAAAFSCFGITSGDVMATPRLLFAGANDGLFPKFLGKIHHKFSTPWLAIIVYALLIFIFAVSGGFKQLAILASAVILLIYLAVILATIKLRMNKKTASEKTFTMPGGFIFPVIGIAAIVWLLTSLSQREILSTLIFISVISLAYIVMKQFQTKKVQEENI